MHTNEILPIAMPEAYLTAIGRVMVNWSQLEGIVDLVLIKLLGSSVKDGRAHIVFAQMTFQAKLDALKAIAALLATGSSNEKAHSIFTQEIYPKLSDFQGQRNSLVHCKWNVENNIVSKARLVAKGKLKISQSAVTLTEIDKLADNIVILSGEVWAMVKFDEFS